VTAGGRAKLRAARGLGALLVGALLLGAAPALAAEEGHAGPSLWLLALQVLNGLVLVGLLVRYGRQPLRSFMAQRRHEIATRIQEAQDRVDAAESELARWRRRLEDIDEEEAAILRAAAEQAEVEQRRVLERAEATAERIRVEAQALAEQEIERARNELRLEAAALSTELAADLVRRNLRDEDDRRLVSDVIERIGGSA
jgi:F-type H+-transporting ATPase subunit b